MKTNILGLPVQESELITELNTLLSNIQVYQNLREFIGMRKTFF
jgi:hypothetical protein